MVKKVILCLSYRVFLEILNPPARLITAVFGPAVRAAQQRRRTMQEHSLRHPPDPEKIRNTEKNICNTYFMDHW